MIQVELPQRRIHCCGGGGAGGGSTKAKGVFEETLAGMKKKKVAEISDVQKQEVVTRFLKQMDQAAKDDDAAFARKEPAVHKLNILKKVQDMVGVKDLQGTLLDFDVLGVLSDWVSPKSDNTLPSHTIRTAVYHMLDILPTQSEHLKRKQDGTQRTVGMVVMSLYRHKQETRENKAVLRALIEKWSRPIFRKGADARSKDYSGNDELHAVVNAQLAQRAQAHAGSVQTAVSFDDAITQRSASDAYAGSRARCPFSGGFLYTAKPQSKNVVNAEQSSTHDQVRRDMLKKMSDMKNANRSGFGRKENKNTMEMEKTGRNKA